MPRLVEFEVVGINYRLTPATMRDMQADLPLLCRLVREPDNSHDENAIKVMEVEKDNFQIGYLARQVAEVLAPAMDIGKFPFESTCLLTEIDPNLGRGTLVLQRRSKKEIAANKAH